MIIKDHKRKVKFDFGLHFFCAGFMPIHFPKNTDFTVFCSITLIKSYQIYTQCQGL